MFIKMVPQIKIFDDCQIISLMLSQITHNVATSNFGPGSLRFETAILSLNERTADKLAITFDVRNNYLGIFLRCQI